MLIFTDFQWFYAPKMSRKSVLFPSLFEKANLAKIIVFPKSNQCFSGSGLPQIAPKSIQKHVRKTDCLKIKLETDLWSIFKGF